MAEEDVALANHRVSVARCALQLLAENERDFVVL